jgi:cyclopropane fatty-acyl-phospholipid synthase-like methyltransferase
MQLSPPEIPDLPAGDWLKFNRIMGGHILFQTLSAAVELDLFGLLHRHGSLTRAQIAEHLGIEAKPARILLLGCATLELVQKDGDQYSNSSWADRLLVREVPGNMVSVIRWQHYINYRAMFYFEDALRANRNVGLQVFSGDEPTLYQRLTHDPEREQIFQDAMQNLSVQANQAFAANVDLSQYRYLVDVGGGNGTNIITLARKYPNLRATVFDSPSVCEIARENIAQAGLSDRLSATPGDCFVDEFPEEADCLIFCHFFTIWSEEKNRWLLQKCRRSLPEGGAAIIFNMMQSDNEDGPMLAAIGSPYFLTLATGSGMLYTWHEYETWMREAGFGQVDRVEIPAMDHGVIIGR